MGIFKKIMDFIRYEFSIETKAEKAKVEATKKQEQKPTSDEDKNKKEDKWKDVNDPIKYVCMGGKVQCTFCSSPTADLIVTSTDIKLQDKPWATVGDSDGKINFAFTGLCNHPSQQKPMSPPPPCKAIISLGQWKDFSNTYIGNDNALLMKSAVPCMISNQDITITDSGQKTTLSETEPKMERKPKVTKMYWMDENGKEIINQIDFDESAVLFVETEDFRPNQIIKISLKDNKTGQISELKGKLDAQGKTKIPWSVPKDGAEPILVEKHSSGEILGSITKVFWTHGDEFIPLGKNSRFYVDMNLHIETQGYKQGKTISIELKDKNGKPLTDSQSTITLSGTTDQNGCVVIREALKKYTLNLTNN